MVWLLIVVYLTAAGAWEARVEAAFPGDDAGRATCYAVKAAAHPSPLGELNSRCVRVILPEEIKK